MSYPAYQLQVYVRGDLVQSNGLFFSDAAQTVPADPTAVLVEVTSGAGVISNYTYGVGGFVTKSGTGVYLVSVDSTPSNGLWCVRWVGTGVVQVAFEDFFVVVSGR